MEVYDIDLGKVKTYTEIIDDILKEGLLGEGFSFRPGQREAIEDILQMFHEGAHDSYILEAPTGTGKSIIAITCSLVLERQGRSGYILASDLGLQTQYEVDFQRLSIPWGSVRGVDNYQCHVNGDKFSLGECRLRHMSYKAASKLPCFSECGYYTARDGAQSSAVSLLNYSYWLIQRNYVARMSTGPDEPFPIRDFVFFDEAHKATSIVQGHFSPVIDQESPIKLEQFRDFLISQGLASPGPTEREIESIVASLYEKVSEELLYSRLHSYEKILREFLSYGKALKEMVKENFKENQIVPPAWRRALGLSDWIKDVHCKIEDYNEIVRDTGYHVIVQEVGDRSVTFYCLDEPGLMKKHLLGQARFKVFMSATLGNFNSYCASSGIDGARAQRMGPAFDYDRSPIYFTPGLKLNYDKKEENFPVALKALDQIIDRNAGSRGIIHTGSYEFSRKILQGSRHSDRLIAYEGTKEKAAALERFYQEPGSVLVGPSIVEGLDLYDDRCRFQVIFKVPYASLGSTLVKKKFDAFGDGWYLWQTSVAILQAVGRAIRNPDDWAETYIIDGCFSALMKKGSILFPSYFTERLRPMPTEFHNIIKRK